ncbi:MAG: hypothetical protein JXI43_14345 [Tissierellales bacterium]|nr:hypothetical protein [Tissierellales bacterium]
MKWNPFDNSTRKEASRILIIVSFEHSESLKMLIASGNFTSAIGLLRLQFESFTRALWLYYAASDNDVLKLMTELTTESERKASKMLMLSEMIKKLGGKAPQVVIDQLIEFKEYSWKPLSSYIHGGIHAIQRHSKGYPLELLIQTIKASNGLSLMVAMFLIVIANDVSKKGLLPKIQQEFKDCLPEFKL